MSVILRLGAVNTDTPYSKLINDGSEYDQPIDMSSPGDDDEYHSPPQTYPGCFGLPYQDHNYGAPPPPTPPQSPLPVKISSSLDVNEEVVVTSNTPTPPSPAPQQQLSSPPKLPSSKLKSLDEQVDDSVTRCICDFIHDDGYMICCDKCSVWQHIVCMGLDRDSIPDTYACEMCEPRPVDRVTAREIQVHKREFLKTLLVHDTSETDTDPEEVNNRMRAQGLSPTRKQQKIKLKKRRERMNLKQNKKKLKLLKKEKENNNREANKRPKLLLKNFPMKNPRKEKLNKSMKKVTTPIIQNENAQEPWEEPPQKEALDLSFDTWDVNKDIWATSNSSWSPSLSTVNSWDDNYEVARYNHYSTYVQEYLNSIYINGHHNDIADLVTDGLRVQRCHVKELKNKRKALQATSPIPNGQPIIEVIGKVMTRQQYDKDNFGQRELSPFVFFYGTVFDLDLVVDATDYGNDARFIRRSCLPNAIVRHVVAGGQAHFIAVATKEVLETSEITIPYDYDYKKWNFCVDCACLRNNCPVRRFQKRMLKFQKQLQIGSKETKKLKKLKSPESSPVKSPVTSPIKSPVRSPIHSPVLAPSPAVSPVKTPEKMEIPNTFPRTPEPEPMPEPAPIPLSPPVQSPPKMVRRSQVRRQHSKQPKPKKSSLQARRKSLSALTESSTRVRSLRVPSTPVEVESTVKESITAPEPTTLRSSEVDALTSPELPKEPTTPVIPAEPDVSSTVPASSMTSTPTQPPSEKRKLTREERKMEAIMKAFEKMEKRQERKNSAHTSKHEHKKADEDLVKTPQKEKKASQPPKEKKKQRQLQLQMEAEIVETEEEVKEEMMKEETVKQEIDEEKVSDTEELVEDKKPENLALQSPVKCESVKCESSPVKTKEEPMEIKTPIKDPAVSPVKEEPEPAPQPPPPILEPEPEPVVEPEVKEKPAVAEEILEEVKVEVKEEEPKPKPVKEKPKGKKARKAAARRRTRLSTAGAAVSADIPSVTPEDGSNSTPLPCPSASCPATPQADVITSPPSFKFLKTKRHLMNEWLIEKNETKPKTEPLEVAVDEENMFVTCLPSPRNSMDRLRRNSQSGGGRPLVQSSAGSAKKRWLRQAMDEGSSDTGGMVSPIPGPSSGGMSPNPLASMPSPGGSPPIDFVTPLKKRRLARESLSRDSLTSESPTPSTSQSAGSCFLNVPEPGEAKLDGIRNKNGFRPFFSPLRPDSIDEESSSKCSADQCSSIRDSVESDLSDSCVGEVHRSVFETETDKVNDSQVDSSEAVKTGNKYAPVEESSEISDSDVKSSENEITCVDSGQQHTVHHKSASSEPDSSDSVCRNTDPPMEVECDSVSVNSANIRVMDETLSSEVDSTDVGSRRQEVTVMESAVSSQQENVALDSNCDSCVRERADSNTDNRLSSSSLSVNNHPCTSSSSPCQHNICDSQKHGSPEKSCVDSSTDKGNQRTKLGNVEVSNSTENVLNCVSHTFEASLNSDINSTDEVSATDNVPVDFYIPDNTEGRSRTEITSMESVGNFVLPSRFFSVSNGLSTEMTVDSTTHMSNTAGICVTNGNSIINSSGLSSFTSLSAYDSDSMDVTSASDAYLGLYDRRPSDEALNMMDLGQNNEADQPVQPKEKKKVSLQEYRKRVKEKTTTTSTVSSVSAALGKNSGAVSSTIKTPIKLDKLPSLPSLPMFEPQRKEFKSSSDLLSPIFNRKEKQEEVTRTMSLSERLRQEFGLDDSTDDEEHKAEQAGENAPPPPPPPPPQQSRVAVTSVSTSIPSLMSIKAFPTSTLKVSSSPSLSTLGSLNMSLSKTGLTGTSASGMLTPPPKSSLSSKILSDLGTLLGKAGLARSAAPVMIPPPPGKGPSLTKPLLDLGSNLSTTGLTRTNSSLISNLPGKGTTSGSTVVPSVPAVQSMIPPPPSMVPPPGKGAAPGKPKVVDVQQKVTKLAAQLAAALKAANGQTLGTSLTGPSTPASIAGQTGPSQNGPVLNNGHHNGLGTVPQVFDYGHKPGGQFSRQNSLPNNPSSTQTLYQGVNKASPPTSGHGAVKNFHNFDKLSPSLGNHHSKKLHGISSSQYQGTSTSPSAGVHLQQFTSSQQLSHNSHKKHSSQKNKFSKQNSTGHPHKYS